MQRAPFHWCVFLALLALSDASRASFRGGEAANPATGGSGNGTPKNEDPMAAAMSMMKAVSDSEHSRSAMHMPSANSGPHNHSKLDVGFAGFEKNLTALVNLDIVNATAGAPWTPEMRSSLVDNVTKALNAGLNDRFKPLKQSIGKTWMALPQDEQKDAYVDQLQSAFAGIFNGALDTIQSHVTRGLKRFSAVAQRQHLSPAELVVRCEAGVTDSLLGEHCYADAPEKPKVAAKLPGAVLLLEDTATAGARVQEAIAEAFCISPVVAGLVHHLNDTMELISMTTRFEDGAMSLAQQKARPR